MMSISVRDSGAPRWLKQTRVSISHVSGPAQGMNKQNRESQLIVRRSNGFVFIYPPTHLCIHPSLQPFHPSIYLPIYPLTRLCIHPLSSHSTHTPPIHPSTHLSTRPPIYASICLSSHSTHPSIYPSIHPPPIHLSKHSGFVEGLTQLITPMLFRHWRDQERMLENRVPSTQKSLSEPLQLNPYNNL